MLSQCNGKESNIAIVLEGEHKGSTIRRYDGKPINVCPVLLEHLQAGGPEPPLFPHPNCRAGVLEN